MKCLFIFRWEYHFLKNHRLFWHTLCDIMFLNTLPFCTKKAAADCVYLSLHL